MSLFSFKENVTREDLAGMIVELCHKRAQQMMRELQQEFRDTRFAFDGDRETITYLESFILHLWLTSKVLAPERELLDAVHDSFFRNLLERGLSGVFVNSIQTRLRDRYSRFYAAWDDKAKGRQFVLGLEIYKCALNDGNPDGEFVSHIFYTVELLMSVRGFMSVVVEFRSKYKIKNA